jgi:prepilin-type N-terminal cleavage/methylation domain-containing protein/prepilin-type processing-associated H-X9-DG protein
MHKRTGFTLIELLVVITVLALLAGLLFPTFAQAREKARAAACLSNCHQIALAARLYLQDYDETFLWNPLPGGLAGQPTVSYLVLLQPYLKSTVVFRCPSYAGFPVSYHWGYALSLNPSLYDGVGYGANEVLISPRRPRTLSSLRHSPSEVALFADATNPYRDPGYQADWDLVTSELYWFWQEILSPLPPTNPAIWNEPPRHHGGMNFVYVDGHARFDRARLTFESPPNGRYGHYRQGYYPHALMQ